MRIEFTGRWVSGYGGFMRNIDRASLLKQHPEVSRRVEALDFCRDFGLPATLGAFHISRSTYYSWRKKLKDSGGRLLSLANRSFKPHNTRRMFVEPKIANFIEGLRKRYPRLGKQKISILLEGFCLKEGLKPLKPTTIGKLINRKNWFFYLGERRKNKPIRPYKKRAFGYQLNQPGDLVQIDTVVRFDQGVKRYILTALDVSSRFAFSFSYQNHSSRSAADFIAKLHQVVPFSIKAVQTDNGSEFLNEADDLLDQRGVVHFFTYPRTPKQNASVERFNRTIQEEFVEANTDLLPDTKQFNEKLIDYLLFYNTKRPHQALKYQVPMARIVEHIKKSNMYATNAVSCCL